jgi:hypothetical protein
MKTMSTLHFVPIGALGLLLACASDQPPPPGSPQPVVPGTQATAGSAEQVVADGEVVDRLANAHCDRSQSCDHIGPGARYRDRADCVAQLRQVYARRINAPRCPGGIGALGVSRCIESLHAGECTAPDEEYGNVSHCSVVSMCLR